MAAAEDALGDALLAALEAWPRVGVPDKPEAWLVAAARRKLVDAARHAKVAASSWKRPGFPARDATPSVASASSIIGCDHSATSWRPSGT